MNQAIGYLDLGVCNCAACGAECMGEKTQLRLATVAKYAWPGRAVAMPVVAGRIGGRPYCNLCITVKKAGR